MARDLIIPTTPERRVTREEIPSANTIRLYKYSPNAALLQIRLRKQFVSATLDTEQCKSLRDHFDRIIQDLQGAANNAGAAQLTTFADELNAGVDCALAVVDSWESGDLAGRVNLLEAWAEHAAHTLEQAGLREKGGE